MKLEYFKDDLLNKDHYILLIKKINIEKIDYLIGMIIDIRYILFFDKIDNFSISEIQKKSENSIENLSYKNKIKIIYSNQDQTLNKLNNISNLDINNNNIENIINRNIRTILELISEKKILLETVCESFNEKKIKTLLKKTPNYWFNILNNNYKSKKQTNNFKVNAKTYFENPEIVYMPNKKLPDNNIIDADIVVQKLNTFDENKLHNYVKTKYNNNWYHFFSNLKDILLSQITSLKVLNNNLQNMYDIHSETNKKLTITNKELKLTNTNLIKKQSDLLACNKKLEKKLAFVHEELEVQKKIRLEKEEKSNKKKKAKKLPKRDYIEFSEFEYLLSLCSSDNIFDKRKKCAFILLYLTGLRVSNLLNFKIKNIKELIYTGYTRIDLIKKGEVEHLITLSTKSKYFINLHQDSFHTLFKYKEDDDLFFTSFSNPKKHIHRSNFNNELNIVLKKISNKFNKNIKTHSFRTTYITDLLATAPLHVVKDIVGHKVVASTEIYYRSSLTHKNSLKILNQSDNYRFKK